MHEFNQSLRYDKRMHAADITGSIAYAKALTKVGILTPDEEQRIVRGLQQVGEEWDNGTVKIPSFQRSKCNLCIFLVSSKTRR